MTEEPDYILELSGQEDDHVADRDAVAQNGSPRKFVSVQFNCCGTFQRIYINENEEAYEGRCPKCLQPVSLRIGPGGTDSRFFTVN